MDVARDPFKVFLQQRKKAIGLKGRRLSTDAKNAAALLKAVQNFGELIIRDLEAYRSLTGKIDIETGAWLQRLTETQRLAEQATTIAECLIAVIGERDAYRGIYLTILNALRARASDPSAKAMLIDLDVAMRAWQDRRDETPQTDPAAG